MGKPMRGGIAGCGFFGQIQLEGWARMPEAEIVAACDPDLERARASAPVAYASSEKMLEEESLDFFDIATRPDSHLPLVRLAASHGVPAICQKPMAPSWDDAVAMVEVAEAAGIRLMIHENWRWQPWYREARRMIEQGAIGEPVSYWFRIRKRDGAGPSPYPQQPYFIDMPRFLIYETLVHQIDTARFLFGEIETVCARARRINPRMKGEDQASLILTHSGGLQGVIDGHRFGDQLVAGEAMGEACFEGQEGALLVMANGDIYDGGRKVWSPPEWVGYKGDSVRATQQHFIHCLETGEPFESGGRGYLKTFGAVEAAYESIARGCVAHNNKWS